MARQETRKSSKTHHYNLITGLNIHSEEELLDLAIEMDDRGYHEYMGPTGFCLGGQLNNEITITSVLFRCRR